MITTIQTVALIGSFRQHYDEVMASFDILKSVGLQITSPKGTPILEHDIPFVRFESDPQNWCDAMVQSIALHRILIADFIYVVSPRGYIGRTTCYEIGRIIQARRPLYFSCAPDDIPISVPEDHIWPAHSLAGAIKAKSFSPEPLWCDGGNEVYDLEKDLLYGQFRNI